MPRHCGQVWGGDCHHLVWGPDWTHNATSSHGPATLWRAKTAPRWDRHLAAALYQYWWNRSRAFRLCWERRPDVALAQRSPETIR
jgi:hypothetical protein